MPTWRITARSGLPFFFCQRANNETRNHDYFHWTRTYVLARVCVCVCVCVCVRARARVCVCIPSTDVGSNKLAVCNVLAELPPGEIRHARTAIIKGTCVYVRVRTERERERERETGRPRWVCLHPVRLGEN